MKRKGGVKKSSVRLKGLSSFKLNLNQLVGDALKFLAVPGGTGAIMRAGRDVSRKKLRPSESDEKKSWNHLSKVVHRRRRRRCRRRRRQGPVL